ncbi:MULTISPECIES: hypothetical protein [Halorussus]|uniref:DUF7289 family protein n=1 Tax=Halorussus TaxID=1070314 RepID=UPI000E210080|nr:MULTISPECIES: hypothetical protein [Halorussus]NHN58347.1 hypothetical protein [Halorussus sp. JP-T4]
MTERGVSDVVGFVLVFALITSTAAIVYTVGFSGLQDVRAEERLSNAERAFDILADNVADLHHRGAPSRATEIKLSDATLGYGDETTLTVEVAGAGSPTPSYSTTLEPIAYAPADSPARLVYENGAVFRERPGVGGVVRHESGAMFRDGATRTAVIPLVQTRRTGTASVGGSSTVRIRTDKAGSEVLGAHRTPSSDPDGDGTDEYEVTYTMETTPTRAQLWVAALNERIPWTDDACEAPDDTVICTFDVQRLYVTAVRVDVSFT